MMTSRITLEVFADADGDMPPGRVQSLLHDAIHHQGTATAPLEYVEPITGGDPRPWGLRIVIFSEDED